MSKMGRCPMCGKRKALISIRKGGKVTAFRVVSIQYVGKVKVCVVRQI